MIKGVVTDSATTQGVSFATVALLNASGKITGGVTTDDGGWFTFATVAGGTYKLTLNVSNPFGRYVRQTASVGAPTFTASSEALYVNRSVRLTFSDKFGSMSAGDARQSKKISNDDSKGSR